VKRQIKSKQLHEAFLKGNLGTDDNYHVWTPLWALRAKIWREKGLRKAARKQLGTLALEAIEEGDAAFFRMLGDALDGMMAFEREPRNALLADVYFAVEDLNENRDSFNRAELLSWLNDDMEAVVTREELGQALETLGLADAIPMGK